MSSRTWRIRVESAVLPGQHHTRTGIPLAGDRHPDHDLGQVVAGVLRLAPGAEPDTVPSLPTGVPGLDGGVGVGVGVGQRVASCVAGGGLVGVVEFEVGGGGVEEQQVDLEVEQVRDLVKHLLLQLFAHVVEPVHRPVADIVGYFRQAVDVHVVADPVRGGERGRRGQGPVGDECEQDPLERGAAPSGGQQLGHDRVDAQPAPQPVEHVGAPEWARADEAQARPGGGPQRRGGVEQPRQRHDQPLGRGGVDPIGPPEAVEDLGSGGSGGGIPVVVHQLQVRHLGAVAVLPLHLPQEHVPDDSGVCPAHEICDVRFVY